MDMKIQNINNINFQRAFTTKERKRAERAQDEARKLLDIDKITAITPEVSLPASQYDSGIGQLNTKTSMNFYNFLKSYAGINTIKLLPQGELRNDKGFYCSYSGSGLTLGSHLINLEELTEEDMGKILSKETLERVSKASNNTNSVNYENVIGSNSLHYQALKEAFDNFKKSESPKLNSLQTEFEKYKSENKNVIENKAIFEILAEENHSRNFKEWKNQTDSKLFDENFVSIDERLKRINEIKSQNADKIEFSYFRQFLAEQNLSRAKKKLNDNGFKLYGDCLIGFSADEIWSNPKAFENGNIASADWGLNALKFSEILDENSESFKLLKEKVTRFAKRYDSIRFDVGWAYAEPIIYAQNLDDKYVFDNKINGYRLKDKLGDRLVSKIENIVKEVKGSSFNPADLIYEIETGPDEFSVYDWNENKVADAFKNRTIVQSTFYLSDDYATTEMLQNRMKIPRENYFYMVGNHDHIALHALAYGKDDENILRNSGSDIEKILEDQYKPLSKELKIDIEKIKKSPNEFIKAKFAQLFLAKNIKIFFADMFGISEQFDSQSQNSSKNYRTRVPKNYEEEFNRTLQQNKGFNLYDSMAKAMKAKGLDKQNKKLYNELVNYAKILNKKGALTEEVANKSARTKLAVIISSVGLLLAGFGVYAYKAARKNNE